MGSQTGVLFGRASGSGSGEWAGAGPLERWEGLTGVSRSEEPTDASEELPEEQEENRTDMCRGPDSIAFAEGVALPFTQSPLCPWYRSGLSTPRPRRLSMNKTSKSALSELLVLEGRQAQ